MSQEIEKAELETTALARAEEEQVDHKARQALQRVAGAVESMGDKVDNMAGMLNIPKAVEFLGEMAGLLGVPFNGSAASYAELRDSMTEQLSSNQTARDLELLFGRVQVALGGAGHLNKELVVQACNAFSTLRGELQCTDAQAVVDRVRQLVLFEKRVEYERSLGKP